MASSLSDLHQPAAPLEPLSGIEERLRNLPEQSWKRASTAIRREHCAVATNEPGVPPKNGEIRKRLRAEGWFVDRTRGSHEQWRHRAKPGIVTIGGKDNQTAPPGTWASIRKQAGWP